MLNQLLRYEPVARFVEDSPGETLLEVGSGSRGIVGYLSTRWRITACDRDFSDYGAVAGGYGAEALRVEASVLELPFPDRSYDVVVALDLVEHIPAQDRPRALGELARVTGRRLVLGCPCGEAAYEADARLARFYRAIRRPVPGWLAEHMVNGFPDAELLRRGLEHRGQVALVPNESVRTHEWLMRLEATRVVHRLPLALFGILRRAPERLRRRVLPALRGWDRAPSYRLLAVLDR